MPSAIAVIATWTAATWWAAAQIAITVGLYVYGSAEQRRISKHVEADQKRDFNASLEDRTITIVSSEMPYRKVYGRARVGSTVVAMFKDGPKDEFKWLICVHADHECDGIEEIYINGQAIGPLDGTGGAGNGHVTGGPFSNPTAIDSGMEYHNGPVFVLPHIPIPGTLRVYRIEFSGQAPYGQTRTMHNYTFTLAGATVTVTGDDQGGSLSAPFMQVSYQWANVDPRVFVQKHLGTPGQTVDPFLASIGVPNTAVLAGKTYTVIRLYLVQPEFQSGIPPIEVLMRGAKLFDARSSTTYWHANPANVIRDYLLSPLCLVPLGDIPVADVITTANVCDEVMADGGKRYELHGAVTADDDQPSALQSMAEAMAGTLVSTTWNMTAGKYVAPVFALSQSDVVGALAVNPGVADDVLFNGVKGQYISPDNAYVRTDFEPFQNTAYVAADGEEKYSNFTFPWTISKQRVHNLCRIKTEDQRNGFTIKAEFSQKAWKLKVGQRITFTSPFLGEAAKIFRITDKSYVPSGVVVLTLKEDTPSIWDESNATSPDATLNTNLPNPWLVAPLLNVTADSGDSALLIQSDGSVISRIHVMWTQTTTQSVFTNGLIEIEWISQLDGRTLKLTVSGDATEAFVQPVEDLMYYTVRVRAVNPYMNVKSNWSYAPLHFVIGKSAPPASVLTLSIDGTILSWSEVTDRDLAGYIFRFQYGNNIDWGSATPLLTEGGYVTESPHDFEGQLPYGPVTIMVKAVDTSGNESLITANIFTDLGDPALRNVVATILFDPTYPGIVTGGAVSGGDVVASALDSFYGTDTQSFYDSDIVSFYEPGSFAQLQYTTAEFEIPIALVGSLAILDIATLGDGVTIEYRFVGAGSFFGDDADPFYDADGDPFFPSPPGPWLPWPGAITAQHDIYQLRVTIGAGAVQPKITYMALVIDAPDIEEVVSNLVIAAGGTVIPYTKPFTAITNVQATLQANLTGARTVEIDKTNPLAIVAKAYDGSHAAVSGASADFTLKGY